MIRPAACINMTQVSLLFKHKCLELWVYRVDERRVRHVAGGPGDAEHDRDRRVEHEGAARPRVHHPRGGEGQHEHEPAKPKQHGGTRGEPGQRQGSKIGRSQIHRAGPGIERVIQSSRVNESQCWSIHEPDP